MAELLFKRMRNYKASILIVDDEPINIEILAHNLQTQYWVHAVNCGRAALEFVQERPVDLILLDVKMPDLCGFEVLRQLKKLPHRCDIPVMFVTGQDSTDDELKALRLGAVDYIRKPFRMPLAMARIGVQIELKLKSDLLESMASADGLTGIANRRKFDESFAALYKDCARNIRSLALVLVDIDYFKQYNDRYGHSAGDEALKRVAAVLHEVGQRAMDVVARVGGEEFALILPSVDPSYLRDLCFKIHTSIAALAIEHGDSEVSQHLTVTIGAVSVQPIAGGHPQALYDHADRLLYKAKNQGRAQTVHAILNK